MEVKLSVEVSDTRARCLLCNALEGGSSYWLDRIDCYFGDTGITRGDFTKGGKLYNAEWPIMYLVPLIPGCALLMSVANEPVIKSLDRDGIEKGLQVMCDEHQSHFMDFVTEEDDQTTGDVFLQCCLFGGVVYY